MEDCTYFSNAHYMHKICARLHFFLQCTIYVKDLRKILHISPTCNICARFPQDCTYFSNGNICTRLAQDGTYFFNAQYMHKICGRLYLFLQCAIYGKYLLKIVLISPMRNICTRFVQDCSYFSNAEYMCRI